MDQKALRYERLFLQLQQLFQDKKNNRDTRMVSIIALLHHKIPGFFWTGFYLLDEAGELMVSHYQGTLACMHLPKNKGVCWAAINQKASLIVDDVESFPGHIACSSQTKSELVVPLKDQAGNVWGCLDVDSTALNHFDSTDQEALEKIVSHFINR